MNGPRTGPTPPGRPDPGLLGALSAQATAGHSREVLDAALALVVTMCQSVIAGADGVSVTLPRAGRYTTVAASNDVVLSMDRDQYATGQGPCLDAARHGQPFAIESLGQEERWSQFVPRARARGIGSVMSAPLLDAGAAHGALNLYARTPGAFAEHERDWAAEFARQASLVLTVAREALPSDQLAGHLEQALASRAAIARAQGWVMHRDGLGPQQSWSVLTAISRRTSRPLRDVCEALLGEQP